MDSDEEYEASPTWRGVPATIILINVFQNIKYHTFETAHAATCRLVKHYLRLSNSQNIGVCVYGVTESNVSLLDIKSLIEIIPLTTPTIDDFKKVRDFNIATVTEAKELILSDVLWHCSKMFANCKRQLSSRTVILLSPFHIAPTENDKRPTLKRVEDLVDSNIDLKLINVCQENYTLDPFYEKFLTIANKGMGFVKPEPLQDPLQIEELMKQELHRHLAVAKIDFDIGSDMFIGVSIYALLKRVGQAHHKTTNLDRETNAVVTNVTKTTKVNTDTTEMEIDSQPKEVPILKSEILYYQVFGGERVEFTANELKAIRNPFGPPKMKLLGFKPENLICKEKWFLKMGYFLFPNESNIEGSTVAFKALHKACIDMSVVAICVLCTRVNAKPIIVALCPCTHPLHINAEIGFDVIPLPFVENVRNLSINEEDGQELKNDSANIQLMKDIINALQFNYKPEMFENPKLQSEYKIIEEKALDKEDIEEFIDTTKPSLEKFHNVRDDLFEEFFGPFGALSLKRENSAISGGNSKKPKIELNDALLQQRINDGTIDAYTVAQLKDILKQKNIKLPALTGMKKKDLVDLVYQYCK